MTGNGIKLYALPYKGENISDAANLMCELMTRPNFEVTAKVNLGLKKNDSCGLVITGGTYKGIRIENGLVKQVSFDLEKDIKTKEIVCAEKKINSDTVYLRLKVSYLCNVDCYISEDGINFEKIGDTLKYNVSRKSWVGGKIGIFAVNTGGENENGYAEFEYVSVE